MSWTERGRRLLPDEVKVLRRKLGLTQNQLATKMGFSGKTVVSFWETGRSPCSGSAAVLLSLLAGMPAMRALEIARGIVEEYRHDVSTGCLERLIERIAEAVERGAK